ncbi:MAG: DNA methyltransferase [Actinomycetes bacterium]
MPVERQADQPANSPIEMAVHCIPLSTSPGETVGDPFCGSGTILASARKLGRQLGGIDVSEHSSELAARRHAQGVLGAVA